MWVVLNSDFIISVTSEKLKYRHTKRPILSSPSRKLHRSCTVDLCQSLSITQTHESAPHYLYIETLYEGKIYYACLDARTCVQYRALLKVEKNCWQWKRKILFPNSRCVRFTPHWLATVCVNLQIAHSSVMTSIKTSLLAKFITQMSATAGVIAGNWTSSHTH